MKKKILALVVILILIQLIRPDKNDSKNYVNDISTVMDVPDEIKTILKTSCDDCHSNFTVYPWYSEIAPISWYLALHVNEGKEHLNFSEWTVYNNKQKKHIIHDLEEVIEDREMPLKSYMLIHKDAEMTDSQFETLMNWVKTIKVE